MKNLIINVDAGEGPAGNELDRKLLAEVDAINIALGGHAGDPNWSRELAEMATDSGKRVHLHPGYPDREGFGRRKMTISWNSLADSLSQQRSVLSSIDTCKFHGAIYNEANANIGFAQELIQWCVTEGITEILAPFDGCLAKAAGEAQINVLREAFIDRRYVLAEGRLCLQPRSEPGAVLEKLNDALEQAITIAHRHIILADGAMHPIQCDTLCFHGDGRNAIDLAKALAALRENWNRAK